jgi:hypothetical protein
MKSLDEIIILFICIFVLCNNLASLKDKGAKLYGGVIMELFKPLFGLTRLNCFVGFSNKVKVIARIY